MGVEKGIYAICQIEKEREIMNYEMAIGINSKCKDGKHVLFVDVDYPHNWEKWVCLHIYEFMRDHNLGFALYGRTEHGFHVIILDKKDFRESNNSGYNLPSNQKDIFYPKIQLSFLFLPF